MAKPNETNGKEWHPDAALLERLAEHYDSDSALAAELGVKPQALNNWKRRGIAPALRGRFFKLAKKHRCAPKLEWLTG
jgi:hypothetical protein